MNCPRLSIVTITKADPDGLVASLSSTAAWRTAPGVEQIVVDGDGGYEAPTVAAGCRWLRQSGTGISGAFNEGLAAARGEWVWFLNGGDRIHTSLSVDWLLGHLGVTRAAIVTGGLHYDGEPDFRPVPPLRVQWPPLSCWLAHPATLVRRDVLNDSGGFGLEWKIAMDYDLWLRLLPRDLPIDVISIPFASFDVNGLCQRPESRPRLVYENARLIMRHSPFLFRSWLGIGRRLVTAWLWATWKSLRSR